MSTDTKCHTPQVKNYCWTQRDRKHSCVDEWWSANPYPPILMCPPLLLHSPLPLPPCIYLCCIKFLYYWLTVVAYSLLLLSIVFLYVVQMATIHEMLEHTMAVSYLKEFSWRLYHQGRLFTVLLFTASGLPYSGIVYYTLNCCYGIEKLIM